MVLEGKYCGPGPSFVACITKTKRFRNAEEARYNLLWEAHEYIFLSKFYLRERDKHTGI